MASAESRTRPGPCSRLLQALGLHRAGSRLHTRVRCAPHCSASCCRRVTRLGTRGTLEAQIPKLGLSAPRTWTTADEVSLSTLSLAAKTLHSRRRAAPWSSVEEAPLVCQQYLPGPPHWNGHSPEIVVQY